jgi:hypothetical protein
MNLKGGLGNQLFQYALGRHLSLKLNTKLALDTSSFESDPLRTFRLNSFKVCAEVIPVRKNSLETKILKGLRSSRNPFNKLFQSKYSIRENDFPFDANILNTPDNYFLDGYWQSEKYFKAIEETIRSDLTLVNELPPALKTIESQIQSNTSVSIHVRRGDYANNPVTTAFHGLYSAQWYINATKKIKSYITDPHFFIFSDDYEWVKNNLILDDPCTYIQPSTDGKEAYDLYLMSQCKHNIIANSSFSWWAAWLNQNQNKKVIAPARWFVGGHSDTRDLIPDNWIRMGDDEI